MSQENEINYDYILSPENQAEAIALARALCPFAEQATDAMMLICIAVVETGMSVREVSEYLTIDFARVRAHCQSHQYNKVLRELARHKLTGEGYVLAINNLMNVASSLSQTGNARNNASKTLLELNDTEAAKNGGSHDDGTDLNEMTLKELEDYCAKIKSDVALIGGVKQGEPA